MVDSCSFSVGNCIDNKYNVVKNLGEGSYGQVYLVDDSYGNKYALKLLKFWEVPYQIREELEQRFEMEYQTGLIDSPYLVRSLGRGWVSGNPYILMEFCPNGDLNKVSNKDINIISRQILWGLKALHSNGKVHRDLKPENVLIKKDGTAALSDFGISGDRNRRMSLNPNGMPKGLMGTYAFMPPEQHNPPDGKVTVLPTTDIFSFGVMFYLLLTGKLPFGRLSDHNELVYYINNVKSGNWNRKVIENSPYYNAISKCLEPDYKRRAQSADDVISLLPSLHNYDTPPELVSSPKPHTKPIGYLLHVMQGEEYGRTYDLMGYDMPITIGRKDYGVSNEISLRETQSCFISRHHCTINRDGDYFLIKDGQDAGYSWKRSTNGTYVNSTEVTERGFYLAAGDIITIGDVKLRFEPYYKERYRT